MPGMMGFPGDEARHVSDDTIRSEVKPFSTSSEVLRKRTPAINGRWSNNEVRACGRSSSTQFTAKF